MKKLLLLLTLCCPLLINAQETVNAEDIRNDLNNGKAVEVSNAKIVGTLDLTNLDNQRAQGSNEWKSRVTASIKFTNCVFEGDVIAYYNTERSGMGYGKTFTTDFEEEVIFENCKFKGAAEFKYSEFAEQVSFEGSYFSETANFKYAEFFEFAGFGNVDFKGMANFKYAEFSDDADFFQNAFASEANFKYAEFDERATFKRSAFGSLANFKYAEFAREGNFTNADFQGDADFKYTKGKVYRSN